MGALILDNMNEAMKEAITNMLTVEQREALIKETDELWDARKIHLQKQQELWSVLTGHNSNDSNYHWAELRMADVEERIDKINKRLAEIKAIMEEAKLQ